MRIKTVYQSTDDKYITELVAFCNTENELYIEVYEPGGDPCFTSQHITLDKGTAIRLIKDLKRQISLMDEGGNNE